jgi:hypothetical protein
VPRKKTILVDFDGVLSDYKGWRGPDQLDPPLPNARKAMYLLAKDYTLVCFTTRPAEPVDLWLRKHGFPHMRVTNIKDPAFLQIDDRALTFKSWSDEFLAQIKSFKTHWESDESASHLSHEAQPLSQQDHLQNEPAAQKSQPLDVPG